MSLARIATLSQRPNRMVNDGTFVEVGAIECSARTNAIERIFSSSQWRWSR